MSKELIKEIQSNYWIESKNTLNSKKILRSPILNNLKELTQFLPIETPPVERFYCLLNNLQKRPICLNNNCNNFVSFSSKGYKHYCSDSCFAEDSKLTVEEKFERYSDCKKIINIDDLKTFLYEKALTQNREKINPLFSKTVGLDQESFVYLFSLIHYTDFLSKDASIKERIYCILKDFKEPLLCPNCNNPVRFISYSSGYNKYCSTKCAAINTIDLREETYLNKYGAKNIFSTETFKENNRQSWIDNHGVENPSQLDSIKIKKETTCEAHHGVKHYHQSQESKNRRYKKTFKRKLQLLKHIAIPLFDITDFEGSTSGNLYPFKCAECGHEFMDTLKDGNIPRCYICYPKKTTYFKIEKEISEWIASEGFLTKVNKKVYKEGSRSFKEIDVFIPSSNLGIEINGVYWHSENSGGKDRFYHKEKQDFFKERGIEILQFLDKEWIEKKSIVKSMILSKLGKYKNKIGGRKCFIVEICKKDAFLFFEENHLQGGINSDINIGLFYKEDLVQVLSISKSRFSKKVEYEITRFASKLETQVVGGFSKLLSFFEKNYNPSSLITYADYRHSRGKIYISNGFSLIKEPSPNYYYIYRKNYNILYNRIKFQKHKLKNILDVFDENLSEWENMQLNNYDRIWDCGSFTFLKEYSS